MAELYPTPTRLALLAAVDRGEVVSDGTSTTNRQTYITARIAELAAADWIQLGDRQAGPRRTWQLTGTGRAILARHRTPGER
jgi:hypothetical protein